MGWGRQTVSKALKESETGIYRRDNFQAEGRKKTEEKPKNLRKDIRDIAEPHTQTDPDFRHDRLYIKITAKAVRESLIREKDTEMKNFPQTIRQAAY